MNSTLCHTTVQTLVPGHLAIVAVAEFLVSGKSLDGVGGSGGLFNSKLILGG